MAEEIEKRIGTGLPGPGATPIYSHEIASKIIHYLRAGAYVETAAVAGGLAKMTFYSWLKKANKDRKAGLETEFTRFLYAVDSAVEESSMYDLATIDKAAGWIMPPPEAIKLGAKPIPPDWRAVAWRLERRRPKLFGRRVPDVAPQEFDVYEVEETGDVQAVAAVGLTFQLPEGEKAAVAASPDNAVARWYDPAQTKPDG